MSGDVVVLDSADVVLGQPIRISAESGRIMINNSQIVIPGLEASNGVHLIHAVLLLIAG